MPRAAASARIWTSRFDTRLAGPDGAAGAAYPGTGEP